MSKSLPLILIGSVCLSLIHLILGFMGGFWTFLLALLPVLLTCGLFLCCDRLDKLEEETACLRMLLEEERKDHDDRQI